MNQDAKKSVAKEKAEVRKLARASRARVHEQYASEGRRLLKHRADDILNFIEPGEGLVIAGYHPIKDEIDCLGLLSTLRDKGYGTALPRMRAHEKSLDFYKWVGSMPLEVGAYGVREPAISSELVVPDIILLPLLSFDLNGGRLGYGGGYYDRTLAALRAGGQVTAIGVGYDAQEVDDVPRDDNDQLLDYIATPTRMITVAKTSS